MPLPRRATASPRPSSTRPNSPPASSSTRAALYLATHKQIVALRQHRGQAGQPRHARGAQRQAARRAGPQLALPAHARRQALLRGRRALQHLRPGRRARAHLPHEPRRQRHRDRGARRAQHGGLRLRSEDRQPLVHRQRPRLAQRGPAERRAQRGDAGPTSTSATRTATRATSPTPNSAGARRCNDYVKPAALLGPHAASLGLTFYNGKMFPAKYQRRHVHRPPRPVEPHREVRRHRGRLARRQGRRARSSPS